VACFPLDNADLRAMSRTPSGRLLLSTHDDNTSWMRNQEGSWVPAESLERVTKMSQSGFGITSDGKVWLDGEFYSLRRICPGYSEGGYSSAKLIDINDGGTILIQARKGGSTFDALVVPIEIQIPSWSGLDADFETAEELMIAKFKGGSLVEADLIYHSDIDRFQVKLGPVKVANNGKVFIKFGTKNGKEMAAYDDDVQTIELFKQTNGKAYLSKLQFLAADDVDDDHTQASGGNSDIDTRKIGPDDQPTFDPSHKIALGGKVLVPNVKIGAKVFTSKLSLPVKARRTVKIRLINPKKSSGLIAPKTLVDLHKKHLKERYAQVGLVVEVKVVETPAGDYRKFTNLELPQGEDGNDPSIMTQDEINLLQKFTDPQQDVIEVVYIRSFKKGLLANGIEAGTFGIAYSSDRPIVGRYKNTAIVGVTNLPDLVIEHEVGHLLLQKAQHDDKASNLMTPIPYLGAPDAVLGRRLSLNQETKIYKHPTVKGVK